VAPLDLRHGLVVLTPLGVVIQLGVAERDIKGAVPHQLFDDLERGLRVEELGGKRLPQRVRGIGLRDPCKFQVPHPKSGGIWERQVPLRSPNDVSSQVPFHWAFLAQTGRCNGRRDGGQLEMTQDVRDQRLLGNGSNDPERAASAQETRGHKRGHPC
jgi:hypothetical protein